jgi:hypothetical protein
VIRTARLRPLTVTSIERVKLNVSGAGPAGSLDGSAPLRGGDTGVVSIWLGGDPCSSIEPCLRPARLLLSARVGGADVLGGSETAPAG